MDRLADKFIFASPVRGGRPTLVLERRVGDHIS
jgi:hypothetical protein